MIIEQTLKLATAELSARGIKLPLLEAEILLSAILKKPREFLLTHPESELSSGQLTKFNRQISRRLKGVPTAYLTGHKEFYGLDFKVNKNVLIPRPETELMVEETLRITRNAKRVTLIDVGTGSGCVAITLAKLTQQQLIAIDISKKALAVARHNAKRHGVYKKIKFIKGDLLSPIIHDSSFIIQGPLVILANLPYLTPAQIKNSSSIKFEPKIAFSAGLDGLDLYRKLARQIKLLKNYKIILLCEIGHLHGQKIKKIFSFAKNIQIKKDLSGLNRLAIIKIQSNPWAV